MLRHHLPFLLSRALALWRHALLLRHSAGRMTEMGLYHLQALPDGFRHAGRALPSRRREAKRSVSRRRRARRPLLIHYHIFKNAGSSFEWALRNASNIVFEKFDGPIPNDVVPPWHMARFAICHPKVTAISSHQAILPAPRIPGRRVVTSILIRDPVARIRSIYAFERRQEVPTPGARRAKEMDFKGYVEWRLQETPAVLCNYQVLFCSRNDRCNSVPTEAHLERAVANLDSIHIVGTVERYAEWLSVAQAVLSEGFGEVSLSACERNVTRSAEKRSKAAILDELIADLGRGLAQQLLEKNELDMCLHQVADALPTRQLAERGIAIALRQAYSDAQESLAIMPSF